MGKRAFPAHHQGGDRKRIYRALETGEFPGPP